MNVERVFFLCPTCFHVAVDRAVDHPHPMLRIDAGALDDERRRPLIDAGGQIRTHAPRWFIETLNPDAFDADEQ
jgi:hypothetical protein